MNACPCNPHVLTYAMFTFPRLHKLCNAHLPAIMSTADSLIIAISQLVTVEVVWPYNPSASHKRLAWIGRLVSLFSVIISLLIGIFWKGGVSAMTAINFPIMIQAV